VDWLLSDNASLKDRTMDGMLRKYEKITKTKKGVTRQHVSFLLKNNGWRMMRSKPLDAWRCVKYNILRAWFRTPSVRRALKRTKPELKYNGDETELNRKRGAPRWIAARRGVHPQYVTKEHTGSHVSLFLITSAAGDMVRPIALLHGKPYKFVDPKLVDRRSRNPRVKCFFTGKGYMTKYFFYHIMRTIFVKQVIADRIKYNLPPDEPAVLIVDGHSSRYYAPTLKLLKKNHIKLLVLPAHSSHLLQPLDLGPNRIIKEKYKTEWQKAEKRAIEKKREKARAEVTRTVEEQSLQPPPLKRGRIQAVAQKVQKDEDEDENTFTLTAAEERVAMIEAADNAVASVLPRDIKSSWEQSKLEPVGEEPPYSLEREKELEQQLVQSGIRRGRTRRTHITGILTSTHSIRSIISLARKGPIKAKRTRVRTRSHNALGPTEIERELTPDLDDVGDYAEY